MPKTCKVFSRLGRAGLNLIFPAHCLNCRARVAEKQLLCAACYGRVSWLTPPLCVSCGEPGHVCKTQGALNGVWAAAWHDGLMAELIGRFKYDRQYALAPGLALVMRAHAHAWQNEAFDLLAPVPLHKRRLVERGFNQAALLAKALKPNIKLALNLLAREQLRPPQVGLNRAARMANVKGIFSVNPYVPVQGLSVLLLDDVWTTGATMGECARTLLKAGAARVGALTLSRAPKIQATNF